jgi:hypothetical protein
MISIHRWFLKRNVSLQSTNFLLTLHIRLEFFQQDETNDLTHTTPQ